jgi:hypothetical protein
MEFEEFKILTIEVENAGLVKILSISELPKDRLFALKATSSPMEVLEKTFELVELALLNPSQSEIFKEMTPPEFYRFYRHWAFRSRMLDEEEQEKEEWKHGEED